MAVKITFQSTPSAWRVTIDWDSVGLEYDISIHTLRMEGDRQVPPGVWFVLYFNPHPPHGG